jgi:hypothetical protein
MSNALAKGIALTRLQLVLESAGWTVRDLDIDLGTRRATVTLHRHDGRELWLSVREGVAILERFQVDAVRVEGRPYLPESLVPRFLGRDRMQSAQQGLNALGHYVAANPLPGKTPITAPAFRKAIAPVMGGAKKSR